MQRELFEDKIESCCHSFQSLEGENGRIFQQKGMGFTDVVSIIWVWEELKASVCS